MENNLNPTNIDAKEQMGCQGSKETYAVVKSPTGSDLSTKKKDGKSSSQDGTEVVNEPHRNGAVYNMMRGVQDTGLSTTNFWSNVNTLCERDPLVSTFVDRETKSTPLHIACSLIDYDDGVEDDTSKRSVVSVIRNLVSRFPDAVSLRDSSGFIPLHYVIAGPRTPSSGTNPAARWKMRSEALTLLIAADYDLSADYFSSNDTVFDDETGGCTPVYHALQALPDDFESPSQTVRYLSTILECNPRVVCLGNAADDDKPLSLLYRRFTRQFDLSEKFFPGDNSRPEVVQHRRRYKMAAGNTWKIIEKMLRPENTEDPWRIVHRAIQVETPPDLLRYIVETNSEELTQVDDHGNIPLHYAAKSKPPESTFPSFYTKYVIDELLYKFPEGASIPDGEGNFPLTLAVSSGKQWIGGGVKSLYDAYPDALKQINLEEHESLKRALELDQLTPEESQNDGSAGNAGVVPDEHHDAIMMIQQEHADVSEVVFAMWAHEEDAGVQMLGCIALARLAEASSDDNGLLRISLAAVAAIVNAMKAHPNEAVVQDKACLALKLLSSADGKREVSFVASGAVAAVVGAMQAHVGDPSVQIEACGALAGIVSYGGGDRATIVASVSGLTALLNALAAHPKVENVQLQGLRALQYITDHPEANLPELPRSQTEPLLLAAKESFPVSCSESADVLLSRLT